MPRLTIAKRVFHVEEYFETDSVEVLKLFQLILPGRNLSSSSSVCRNFNKYRQYDTRVNRNKENPERRKCRPEENNRAVREQQLINPDISARRNGLGLLQLFDPSLRLNEPLLKLRP